MQFHREQRITILMVTHQAEMASFADRTIHFLDGMVHNHACPGATA